MFSPAAPTMSLMNSTPPFCLSSQVRPSNSGRRPFTVEEDAKLLDIMTKVQFVNWEQVAASLGGRTSRQVRERWVNYLNPNIRTDPWNDSEDLLLLEKVNELGRCWSNIGKFFNGRSENDVKNRWYSHLRYKAIQDDSGKYQFVTDQSQSLYPDRKKRHRVKVSPQQNALRVLEQQRNRQQQAQIQQQHHQQFQQIQHPQQPHFQFNPQICYQQQFQPQQIPQMIYQQPQIGMNSMPMPQLTPQVPLVQPQISISQISVPQITPHSQNQSRPQKQKKSQAKPKYEQPSQISEICQEITTEKEDAGRMEMALVEELDHFSEEATTSALQDVDDLPEPEYVDFWDPHLFDEATTETSTLQFSFNGLSLY
ncbi:hypothetical protein TRFO_04252 [Tritrichomonas foetus]|uniref:Myb-like DNA-binding domain containing protein n=1 Tax=Tritrichomonas foetus TaxID=1144522 RepID=A0A1J4KFQ1_9EUKA|nr:hypothetical protein TRFO_04252 [Tritrichomonas foetus]|eukprot:OHT10247.1 hypothetical protein TRFO_04252 [Tritrichomonas foetus]